MSSQAALEPSRRGAFCSPFFLLLFLIVFVFSLSTKLCVWEEQAPHVAQSSGGLLTTVMGDSRRLFANHFFIKADAYLHSGVYPGIFDSVPAHQSSHLSEATVHSGSGSPAIPAPAHTEHADADEDHDHDEDAASAFLGPPRDWLDAFGRHFFPTRHTHLKVGDQHEILPWLEVAAELNPNDVQTYTVAAYWLRSRMGKVKEAEAFLREGWRLNPDSYEILFELGRLDEENHHDPVRAINLYEAALRKWRRSQLPKGDPDNFTFMEITGRLARLEEKEGHPDKARLYLEMLRKVSPHPDSIQAEINALSADKASIVSEKAPSSGEAGAKGGS